MNRKYLVLLFLGFVTLFLGVQICAAKTMKPHHSSNALSCNDCHTNTPPEAVPMEQCLTCHDLPAGKEDYHGAPDKHDSPHYGPELECENCHFEHQESVNFCADCHDFIFNVP